MGSGVRLVQLQDVRNDGIAIDGAIVSGQELRDRLGADGDLIVRLSYVDESIRERLFGIEPAQAVSEIDQAPEPSRASPTERRTVSSGIVRFGGPVTIGADERVDGDVVVLGGPLTVNGSVDGDVVVIGGPAMFGPDAEVDGEVTVVGGPVTRRPTAAIHGGVHEVGFGGIDFDKIEFGEWVGFNRWPVGVGRGWFGGGWDLAGTVIRLLFLALVASVVVFVAQGSVERVSERSANEPLKAGVVGFLTQILLAPIFVLGIVVLVVSIIGIPLLVLVPFAIIGVFIAMVVGFAGAAHAFGRWLGHRLGRGSQPVYLSVWIGIALILVPAMVGEAFGMAGGPIRLVALLIALTGTLIEYAAWTTGLGAIVLNRFGAPLPSTTALPQPPSQPVRDVGMSDGQQDAGAGEAPTGS